VTAGHRGTRLVTAHTQLAAHRGTVKGTKQDVTVHASRNHTNIDLLREKKHEFKKRNKIF